MIRVAALSLLVCCACTRSFDLPNVAVRSVGVACDNAAVCTSGHCVDGVCCATSCAASDSCNATGSLGTCTPRALGTACTGDAQCPSGHCADSVCCNSACASTCQTCARDPAVPGSAGACRNAANNTDARRDCGICSACFLGQCEPALVGTDPNQRCPAGLVCGASQSCGLGGGATCTASADCAAGECVGGSCELATVEHILQDPMSTSATARIIHGLSGSAAGGVAVLFVEFTQDSSMTFTENDLFLAVRAPQGGYTVLDLLRDLDVNSGGVFSADVRYLGETAYVGAYSHQVNSAPCMATNPVPCGVFGELVSPGGQLGRLEQIDPDAIRVAALQLLQDEEGRLIAAYDADLRSAPQTPHKIYFRRRDVDSAGVHWTALASIAPVGFDLLGDWTALWVDGRPQAFFDSRNDDTITAYAALPDQGPDTAPIPAGCVPGVPLLARGAATFTLVTTFCIAGSDTFYLLTYDVTQSQGRRWSNPPIKFPPFTTGLVPMGLLGGQPGFGQGVNTVNGVEARVAILHADGSIENHLAFAPRGGQDLADLLPVLGPDGLPSFAVTQGPVDANGFTISLDLYLVRFHH